MWIILNVLMRSASGFSTAPADCHKVRVVISARAQCRRAMAGARGCKVQEIAAILGNDQ